MKKSSIDDGVDPAQFPIFSHEDYDFEFKAFGWPIGLKSTYPIELVRRVAAARVSYHASLRSIDYAYKQYVKDTEYDDLDDGSRLDLRISAAIKYRLDCLSELILRVTMLDPKREGEIISEWTFLRVPFSVKFLLGCANRGAFFECGAIARMILEQIAWSTKIDTLNSYDAIQRTSATRAIGALKGICPPAGAFYGWLSNHAHWQYDAHVKAMSFEGGRLASLFATPLFKRRALALTIVLTSIAERAFKSIKSGCLEAALDAQRAEAPEFSMKDLSRYEITPSSAQLRARIASTEMPGLMEELSNCELPNSDLKMLSELESLIER